MRFLHLSDLHIGRRLENHSLLDDQRHILKQACDMAKNCDAVLISGDLYDKAQPNAEAISLVSWFFVSLSALLKPVFVISGNHDSPEQIAYCRALMENAKLYVSPPFGGAPERYTLTDEFGELHIWLLPFIKPAMVRPYYPEVRSYEDAVRAALEGAHIDFSKRNVLLAHQFVLGANVCESETRLLGGVDEIGAQALEGFDYVALGHLHSPQKLMDGHIRYCGSPLKYSLSEAVQRKAALLVTLDRKGSLAVEEQPFKPLHDLRVAKGTLRELTDEALYSEDYVYAVLTDENAPLDPMGVLRLTYPNLIGMRVKNSHTNETSELAAIEAAESRTPLEHFAAFYEAQNNHQPPDECRLTMMREVFEEAEEHLHEAY